MLVAEDHGGGSVSGQGLSDLSLVAEEFGRMVTPGPLIPPTWWLRTVPKRWNGAPQAPDRPGRR